MSRDRSALEKARMNVELCLTRRSCGTRDRPRSLSGIELALQNAEAWLNTVMPSVDSRGGSSHPTEIDDLLEDRRIARTAAAALVRIPEVCSTIERLSYELYHTVAQLTEVIDHAKLPDNETAPGCRSCARTDGNQLTGNFEKVYEKAKRSGLCRWCYDYTAAEGRWPAVKACHIRHDLGPRQASLWMKKNDVPVVSRV